MNTEHTRNRMDATSQTTAAELGRMVDRLKVRHPELESLERLRAIQDALNVKIDEEEEKIHENSSTETWLTTVATAVGAATAGGLIAATALPTVPWLTVVSIVAGLIGTSIVSTAWKSFGILEDDKLLRNLWRKSIVFGAVMTVTIGTLVTLRPGEEGTTPVCSFASIKQLGWRSGHKTNFCKSRGYQQGNFNQGEYKNGGICLAGAEPEVCKKHFIGKVDPVIRCERKEDVITCYRLQK